MFKVWLMYFVEAMGFPLPAEIPLLLSAGFITTGRWSAWLVIGSVYLVSSAGNILGYLLGRVGGRPLLSRFGLSRGRMEKLEAWVERRGLWALIVTRWLNWGFGQSLWVAGLTRVPWRRFLSTILINNLLWASVWILFGASLLDWLERVGLNRWVVLAGLLVLCLGLGYLLYRKTEARA